MRARWMTLAALAAAVAVAHPRDIAATAPAAPQAPDVALAPEGGATLLSYNVEGLPWPVRFGRAAAADRIAASLAGLRAEGRQPHIVAVQEAFSGEAQAIGARAGYAYRALGPAPEMPGAAPRSAADLAFANQARVWRGEALGKAENSGLALFSDYPILWTRAVAFPDYACAGWDCLANKGVLLVALQRPGEARPLIVADTHLNARGASGASGSRSGYAYRRQVDALRAALAAVPGDADLLLAGDFNIGGDPAREAVMRVALFAPLGLRAAAVEAACGATCRRPTLPGPDAAGALAGAKSLIAYRAGLGSHFAPAGLLGHFGGAGGQMLSDHVGIERRFLARG
ncbi:endonuclease/exonuclease/phosphatase family protein [Sphingomonas morindae]|uniref:Endonuclease/exonuclease/phosphatase family protein n=1 Tax=Sphingomonas morindae TaxID=1541170 RepID=A0ABY4X4U0_9SPHN|nr:endonuclease/exonuclease/phosphatase family protein [Sphingomonas morindae]USI71908.1 endonuclease/exonuclease/phosphatase family protein [Sphingomonas morindae]